MSKILDSVPMCTIDDEPRFHELLEGLIGTGELPQFRKFELSTTAAKKKV